MVSKEQRNEYIRELYKIDDDVSYRDLAAVFNLSEKTIGQICREDEDINPGKPEVFQND